jgi:hypothetical protein
VSYNKTITYTGNDFQFDEYQEGEIITRDKVSGDNFFTECLNHPNTFIQGQYVFYYTECLMIQVCILLLEEPEYRSKHVIIFIKIYN